MAEIAVKATCGAVVMKISVKAGDLVEAGQELLLLESMKTEIPVSAPITGRVSAIEVEEGQTVNERQPLVLLAT